MTTTPPTSPIIVLIQTRLLDAHPDLSHSRILAAPHPLMVALTEDIEQNGVKEPLLVSRENFVVDGRHRLEAARAAGLEEVPCIIVDNEDVLSIMLRSAALRKNFSKGLLAYDMCPLLERAAAHGKSLRAKKAAAVNPDNIKGATRKSSDGTFGKRGMDEVEKMNHSGEGMFAGADMKLSLLLAQLGIARNTYFAARDARASMVSLSEKSKKLYTKALELEAQFYADDLSLWGFGSALSGMLKGGASPRDRARKDSPESAVETLRNVAIKTAASIQKQWAFVPEGAERRALADEVSSHLCGTLPGDLMSALYSKLDGIKKLHHGKFPTAPAAPEKAA